MRRAIPNTLKALAFSAALSIGTAAAAQPAAPPVEEPDCQRECLEGWVDRYLAAMRDGNVDPALFARGAKFTENGVELPLGGHGLWFSMSDLGGYKFYVPDIETQQVAFIGTVKEEAGESSTGAASEQLVAIALRLRIENDRITEVEQLAIRPQEGGSPFPDTGAAVEAMGAPHPVFSEAIPEAERASRAELIEQADYYFEGLQRNDGQGYYNFTEDCVRFENGVEVLANYPNPETGQRERMTCKKQFEVALKDVVDSIRDRRFVAVDRERGIVFAFAFFDHKRINWTWQLGELFKLENGLISRIEAVFLRSPYGMQSGWSTYEQGMSEEIQDIR